jgi:ubiquinone/menaquinone biosynthesis C-methylase UbiE/uncharacterized protein YbaR (Trm112 family)
MTELVARAEAAGNVEVPTWELLACPICHGHLSSKSREIICEKCGRVGVVWRGIPDFLGMERSVPLANDGSFDLAEDAEAAEKLAHAAETMDASDLTAMADDLLNPPPPTQRLARRAKARFEASYRRVAAEVGVRAGEGEITKVNSILAEEGRKPLDGAWALEGGGGFGLHLPGLRKTFDGVVMVDCSLSLMVLARKLCERQGLSNVNFVRANLEQLPFRTDAFDFVHENGVIEHVSRPQLMVDEALRCTAPDGVYACISPNRFPVTPEPHFRLPLFGLWPPFLRRWLLPWVRGVDSEAGTDLRSLREIRRYLKRVPPADKAVVFLPPSLPSTVRLTPARRFLSWALATPVLRALTLLVVNRLLLPIAPYHVAVVTRTAIPAPMADRRAVSPSAGQ